MNLVSMKTGDEYAHSIELDNPYGYGLCLHLNPEQCKALGLDADALKPGTKVGMHAIGQVTRTEQELERGETKIEVRLSIQITDLAVRPEGAITASLYGE